MAELMCRSCREPVTPGDLICPHCRANLTSGDAVIDSAALDETAAAEPEPESADAGADTALPGEAVECPSCGSELPTVDTPACPACLAPLGGAVALRLDGGHWRHVVLPGSSLVLGRDPKHSPAATALAPHDTVSRRHARVTVDDSRRATVADLDSTNGTFVDDVRVRAGVTTDLRPGSRLRLGSTVYLVVEEA